MEKPAAPKDGRLASGLGIAVVTGAAGGVGSAFAHALADRGYDLFLTDHVGLDRLAEDWPDAMVVGADLSRPEDTERLAERLAEVGPTLLVNNAGFGTYTMFAEANLTRQLDMVAVHVGATMHLTRAVLPGMIARGHGTIVNVASAGAFLRFPRDATYIGTKAFLVAFTECLAIELVGTGVTVQALCPGWVRTDFTGSDEFTDYIERIPRFLYTSAETVVASSLASLGKGVVHIPTVRMRLARLAIGSRTGLATLAWIRRRRTA